MSKTRNETQAEEEAQFLERAAEIWNKILEEFERDKARRGHNEVMESLSREMWRKGEGN